VVILVYFRARWNSLLAECGIQALLHKTTFVANQKPYAVLARTILRWL
jgi:hypothetical protein